MGDLFIFLPFGLNIAMKRFPSLPETQKEFFFFQSKYYTNTVVSILMKNGERKKEFWLEMKKKKVFQDSGGTNGTGKKRSEYD